MDLPVFVRSGGNIKHLTVHEAASFDRVPAALGKTRAVVPLLSIDLRLTRDESVIRPEADAAVFLWLEALHSGMQYGMLLTRLISCRAVINRACDVATTRDQMQ